MARSRLTYTGAVKLLGEGDSRISKLDQLLGLAIFAGAPFTNGGSLGLVDPKNEAVRLLRDLTGNAAGRIKGATGKRHYELVDAAHTVLVLSSFFEAFAAAVGPAYEKAGVTDDEKLRMGGLDQPALVPIGIAGGRAAVEKAVFEQFRLLYQHAYAFVRGLAATEHSRIPPAAEVVADAIAVYRERFDRLAVDVPEIGFRVQVEEQVATRELVTSQTDSLTRLTEMLERITDVQADEHGIARRLSNAAAAVLQNRLWRIGDRSPAGITFPTVEQGFVSPRFRLAVADEHVRAADDNWWEQWDVTKDLAGFLARHLTDSGSARQPLVLLGHPGAGKSLLTEVVAARLPAGSFTTVRVPLRSVQADIPIHRQIAAALDLALREEISWRQLCRETRNTIVLLLDGFDELVQATGVAHSDYLRQVAEFQEQEWVDGQPVIAIVTSRTLVMDRTRIPVGTVLIRLESFDESQVARWVDVWNQSNPGTQQLSAGDLLRHGDLSRQPLLLLMLAVYSYDQDLGEEVLSSADLYRRLLDTFILRQIRDKSDRDLGDDLFEKRQAAQRQDLAIAAFGMFNRGQQHISESHLDADLDVLHPETATDPSAGHGAPLTRAKRTIAAFFFVHVAQADGFDESSGRRSYEFLHATFGEYLIAERTVQLITGLANIRRVLRETNSTAAADDKTLRMLLSYQPLTKGEAIPGFCGLLFEELDPDVRAEVRLTALDLLRSARQLDTNDWRYTPVPFDAVDRLAAYTANMVLLTLMISPNGIDVADLPAWRSTVQLWRSGLDDEAQKGLFDRLVRSGNLVHFSEARPDVIELRAAELAGDGATAAIVDAGRAAWNVAPGTPGFLPTEFDRTLHVALVRKAVQREPMPMFQRLKPFDESAYEHILAVLEDSTEHVFEWSSYLLLSHLVADARQLPGELLDRLVRRLITGGPVSFDRLLILFASQRQLLPLALPPTELDVWSPAKSLDLLRQMDDEVRAIFAGHIEGVRHVDPVLGWATAAPSMVTTLWDNRGLLPEILTVLEHFGSMVWEQITPTDFLYAVQQFPGDKDSISGPVTQYVEARRDAFFEAQDAAAMRALETWVAENG